MPLQVALLVSAWIEILSTKALNVCSLVALLVSAWIEILVLSCVIVGATVALLVSAWIEMQREQVIGRVT